MKTIILSLGEAILSGIGYSALATLAFFSIILILAGIFLFCKGWEGLIFIAIGIGIGYVVVRKADALTLNKD